MRRRDFLSMGVAAAGSYAASSLLAQPAPPIKRAAIVIGVNKTGQLPILRAAASGANDVAAWFLAQGFDYVKPITDESEPVRRDTIFREISKIVRTPTVEQLVVFFAGHGLLKERDEIWLLSDAPSDGNEAIRVVESGQLARETTAIRHVIFISDACRTIPKTREHLWTHGGTIFPNERASQHVRPNVDHFWATVLGHPSYEGPITDELSRVVGYYTECFLDAFKKPQAGMVVELPNGDRIVTNVKLHEYLLEEVPKRAAALSITRNQVPDAIINSGSNSYIGRLGRETVLQPAGTRPASLLDAAEVKFALTGLASFVSSPPDVLAKVAGSPVGLEFDRTYAMVDVSREPVGGFLAVGEIKTGFTVSGASLIDAVAEPSIVAVRSRESVVAVDLQDRSSGIVALRFAGGSGTVLPALKDHVGHIVVDRGVVADVSYVRAHPEPDDVRQLRAAVASAAKLGVFRIEGDRETRSVKARALEARLKSIGEFDPSLALYAAYAYDQADLSESVQSLALPMLQRLRGAALFDIAMLGGMNRMRATALSIVPFCPMLTQGWGLLRVKNVSLRPEIERAREHLLNGLWTTFDLAGIRLVSDIVGFGRHTECCEPPRTAGGR